MSDIPVYEFRRLLEETPLTDVAVAEELGVSHTTVYRWRTGQATPSVDHTIRLARLHTRKLAELRQLTMRLSTAIEEKVDERDRGGYRVRA